jgi:hypothetical protein
MIIGIIGYFTVPSVANYIVHAGGDGALGQKVTSMFSSSTTSVMSTASQGTTMAVDAMGNAAGRMYQSMANSGSSAPYFKDQENYMTDKLKGKS